MTTTLVAQNDVNLLNCYEGSDDALGEIRKDPFRNWINPHEGYLDDEEISAYSGGLELDEVEEFDLVAGEDDETEMDEAPEEIVASEASNDAGVVEASDDRVKTREDMYPVLKENLSMTLGHGGKNRIRAGTPRREVRHQATLYVQTKDIW
jgi:hypothetical protein